MQATSQNTTIGAVLKNETMLYIMCDTPAVVVAPAAPCIDGGVPARPITPQLDGGVPARPITPQLDGGVPAGKSNTGANPGIGVETSGQPGPGIGVETSGHGN